MPEQMRDVKRRIRSTQSMEQITKAMEMVAAVQLRRSQERVAAARPYAETIRDLTKWLRGRVNNPDFPMLRPWKEKKICYLIFTSDRGMCGAYNARVIKEAQLLLKEHPEAELVVIGRKGRDFFRRGNYQLVGEYVNLGDAPETGRARQMARPLLKRFLDNDLVQIHLIYTEFISNSRQSVKVAKLLPLQVEKTDENEEKLIEGYIIEPDPETVLDMLLPRYVEAQIYRAMLEAKASEQAQRMLSMGAATENAGEMIKRLTLTFNKARQAAITKELSEIVGGAEALKG